jgi:hypothetical protein
MPKLNQIIAVESGVKSRTNRSVTDAYHQLQKPQPFSGITRTYRPRDEDGEQLPGESTRVMVRAQDVVDAVLPELARLFDVVATKDQANTQARADVVVGEQVLAEQVPVTTLLFLEKQLNDLASLIGKMPTLDPAETWHFDEGQDAWASAVLETHRTKKVPQAFIKAPATDKHPAQVEVILTDEVVGYWQTVKFSGALPATRVRTLLERVVRLQDAVKFARERANSIEVEDTSLAGPVLGYLFAE